MAKVQRLSPWECFVETGYCEPGEVRDVILKSWERSRRYGVSPWTANTWAALTGGELRALLETNSRLIQAARLFMENLYDQVKSSGFVVTLIDKNGFLLEVIGNKKDERGNKFRYIQGVQWTEEKAGTTAITLALRERIPIQVTGTEHYCRQYHDWACSAAPIYDADGSFLGILNVAGPKELVHCHTLGMVVASAAAITNIFQLQKAQKSKEENARIHSTIVNSVSDGLLMIDGKGTVTFINPVGARILNVNAADAVGRHISSLVDFKPVVLQVLETGVGYTDREFVIETKRGTLHFVKTAIPLKDEAGNIEGVIDIFREIKRIRKLVNQMVGATAQFSFDDLIGSSSAMRECIRLGRIAANCTANVLIQGESGTGKELVAQAIHKASSRADGPFVAINCGAIPRNLVESELFGYEDGAFTGARSGGRPGKFELAHGGTVFLDEIGEMPLEVQVRFLRVLQEKRITRVGGQRCQDIDVRIIAATNRDVAAEVREGNFRHDLYYRLNVLPIFIPPLRERSSDIPLLVDYLLRKMCGQLGVETKYFSAEAMKRIMAYEWPGNVRELENMIERAIHISEQNEIGVEHLPRIMLEKEPVSGERLSLKELERKAIAETIASTGGNISRAARLLGIGRNTLYGKLKEYGIGFSSEHMF